MNFLEKNNFKKILSITGWSLLGLCGLVLLIAALNKKNETTCSGIEIQISGVNNNFFIDKQDIIESLQSFTDKKIKGRRINEFNLDSMEQQIKKDVWINKAELYFDRNGLLKVEIEEKDPVARVFCSNGGSFYIDNEKNMLPLSKRHSARLPVFTNFPSSLKVLSVPDSNLLNDVKMMGLFIQHDPFLMAMIDQIDINAQRQFELVPKIGEQIIFFGDATDLDLKFDKLKLFYKKIIPVYGWSKYSKINLAYKGQLVTTIRGSADVAADSIRTLQLMKVLAAYSSLMSADTSQAMVQDNDKNTTDANLINKSLQREDSDNGNEISTETKLEPKPTAALPVVKPAVKIVEVKTPVTKPAEKKSEVKKLVVIPVTKKTETKKPVVVTMPKKSPPASVKPKTSVAKPEAVKTKPVAKPVNEY